MILLPKFRFGSKVVFILLGVSLSGSNVSAEGGLRMVAPTDAGRQRITLNQENGNVSGQIQEGLPGGTPVHITYGTNLFTLHIGKQSYPIDRIESGQYISYGGLIENDRGISAQAEKTQYGLTIIGTIENEAGDLVDFTAVSDTFSGALKITWENNVLLLQKETHEPGNCSGNLIRQETQTMESIECQSFGTLKDALFKNPDQILAWLVIPLID